jgi:hypothetical protein
MLIRYKTKDKFIEELTERFRQNEIDLVSKIKKVHSMSIFELIKWRFSKLNLLKPKDKQLQ